MGGSMKFVHSLDDNVLMHIAGGLTAVVAAVTALFSGHTLINAPTTPLSHPPPSTTFERAHNMGDTGFSDSDGFDGLNYIYSDSNEIRQLTDTNSPDAEPYLYYPLCDRILQKEIEVDALNTQLDGILTEIKTRQRHRRK
jgi:hypothetical protein